MSLVSLGSVVRSHAEQKGDSVALDYPDSTLTWTELETRSNRRARKLRSMGVVKDDLVAIMLPNGSEFHEAVVAVWKAGATPCILPSRLPGHEAAEIFALARPAAVIGQPQFAHNRPQIALDADFSQFDATPLDDIYASRWKAVASGGSSGRPKIIVDTMPAAIDPAAAPFTPLGVPTNGAMLNPGPLYHNMPFLFTSFGLMAGAKVVGMRRFDPEECLRLIEKHKVEFVGFVPTMMHRIWALPSEVRNRYDLSSLKFVWHMAAPCPPWLKHFWIDWLGADKIFEAYGGTEAGGCGVGGVEWLTKPGTVGKVIPGTLRILRGDGTEAAVGEVGEVHFPPALANKFEYIGSEMEFDANGGYTIGDLGHMDKDGFLFLADRRSDLILRGGANIYPAEVEAALEEHPLVASSAVIGLPDGDLGERVHAIVQVREGDAASLGSIVDFVSERLTKSKCPASYELSDTPLRDDAGKLRRSALKSQRVAWLNDGRTFVASVQ